MMLARQPLKEPAPAEAGVRVSSIFSSTQPVSFEYFDDHLVIQAARSRRASARLRRSYSQRSPIIVHSVTSGSAKYRMASIRV